MLFQPILAHFRVFGTVILKERGHRNLGIDNHVLFRIQMDNHIGAHAAAAFFRHQQIAVLVTERRLRFEMGPFLEP